MCIFLCSDADGGYSSRRKLFFQSWYPILHGQTFDHAGAFACTQRNVPTVDFLHLANSARSKRVRNPICVDWSSLRSTIDATSMDAILHLDNTLTDQWQIGAMRDSSAIRLFSFENALERLQNGNSLMSCRSHILLSVPPRFTRPRFLEVNGSLIQSCSSSCSITSSSFPAILMRQA
jgi:hypothetical protein